MPSVRSRVSNGNDLFLEAVDGRSARPQVPRHLLSAVSDIGGDPSEAQSIIARRAATLAVWCEQAESGVARGEKLDVGEYATATNTLRWLLLDLGLERRMRDITPRLTPT